MLGVSIRKRIHHALIAVSACLLAMLFTMTRLSSPGSETRWPEAFKIASTQWLVWLIAIAAIIRLDKAFPVSRESLWPRLLLHVPSSLVVSVFTTYLSVAAVHFVTSDAAPLPGLPAVLRQSWRNGFYTHVMIYWAIVGVYIAYDYHRRLLEREVRNATLERLVSESQLQALRSQLHPHFLFNSLNAISAYVERNPRIARKMLEQLGSLLRLALKHSNDHEISLDQELTFIRYYLELQQVRFEGRLQVEIHADSSLMDALVPTFVFQPLVENAIRYGMENPSGKSILELRASHIENRLCLTVEDDGPGLPPSWNLDRNAGIGLSNTRERLRWLYGETSQSLEISAGKDGRGVRVSLVFPFRSVEKLTPSVSHDQYSRASH